MTTAIVAFAACALACWLVVASTAGLRLGVGLLLVACGFLEIVVAAGWIFAGATYSVLVFLALATVVVLITGIAMEEGQPRARPFRYARLHVRIGTLMSGAFSFLTVGLIVFFLCGVWAFGAPATTPSSASVLPMPSSLTVIANVDNGCSGSTGPQLVCSRVIDLQLPAARMNLTAQGSGGRESGRGRGSGGGRESGGGRQGGGGPQAHVLPSQELAYGTAAADMVTSSMTRAYGWNLTASTPGTWHSCRSVGWWLDKHTVCASVTVRSSMAVVTLNVANDW